MVDLFFCLVGRVLPLRSPCRCSGACLLPAWPLQSQLLGLGGLSSLHHRHVSHQLSFLVRSLLG